MTELSPDEAFHWVGRDARKEADHCSVASIKYAKRSLTLVSLQVAVAVPAVVSIVTKRFLFSGGMCAMATISLQFSCYWMDHLSQEYKVLQHEYAYLARAADYAADVMKTPVQ